MQKNEEEEEEEEEDEQYKKSKEIIGYNQASKGNENISNFM